jgi:hypothetical protein
MRKDIVVNNGLLAVFAFAAAVQAQQPPLPVWELGRNPIDPAASTGKVELVNGIVTLDGAKSFSLPRNILGAQRDYTVEFELKYAPGAKGGIQVVSNCGENDKFGFRLNYAPPDYNALLLFVNGYQTVEQRGFMPATFAKVTLVAKDGKLMIFRDGLILALTDEVKPSPLPLTFGAVQKALTTPYELRNIRVFDQAVFPTGFDQSAERMRSVSGEGYAMQRVDVKDPKLPRILVVGDSISMGYRGFITEHFKGRAYVDYWVGGSWFNWSVKGDDFPALRAWDGVLSNGPYDVVSWNAMTLHMWNGAPGRCDETNYPGQMTRVVRHLLKIAPNTRFIWVRCTPWRTTPDSGRPVIDPTRNAFIVRLNAVTDRIMTAHGIPEIDLYALCEKRFDTVPDASKDAVHWNRDVSKEMADMIVQEIEKSLTGKHKPGGNTANAQ